MGAKFTKPARAQSIDSVKDASTLSDGLKPPIGVGATALLTAAMRAVDATRTDGYPSISTDIFAERLAGEAGKEHLDKAWTAMMGGKIDKCIPNNDIAVRSRICDELIRIYLKKLGNKTQLVLLGSGLDTRAYRMNLPKSQRVFELDFPTVLHYKQQLLKNEKPTCRLKQVAFDLGKEAWAGPLRKAGFDIKKPSVVLAEGLFYYLTFEELLVLATQLKGILTPGSILICDILEDPALVAKLAPKVVEYWESQNVRFVSGLPELKEALTQGGWQVFEDEEIKVSMVESICKELEDVHGAKPASDEDAQKNSGTLIKPERYMIARFS